MSLFLRSRMCPPNRDISKWNARKSPTWRNVRATFVSHATSNFGRDSSFAASLKRGEKSKMISCVAVIGAAVRAHQHADSDRTPLYIRTFDEEEDLGFHYIAHVSLDIIDEKLRSAGMTTAKDDMYLGFLGPIEDYRVYGYVTNTSIKFVAIMQDSPVRESELRSFFAEMHKMYVNAMSNPFAPIGERITSQSFEKKVYNLVLQHNTANA